MNSGEKSKGGLTAPFVAPAWDLGRVTLTPPSRPLVMGIVNLTPDSFWAGSRTEGVDAAVEHALSVAAAGADLLDLGAESTRPGAEPVDPGQEQERLLPVLTALRAATDLPLTVDTRRAATARMALGAGADAVNDISGGADPDMLPLVAERDCGLVLMHMQGMPQTMQQAPRYHDVVAEVTGWLTARCRLAQEAGIPADRLVVDPGIGFGKKLEHNLHIFRHLAELRVLGRPVVVGPSRKSFIGAISDLPAGERLEGTIAAVCHSVASGADVVRVHDVAAVRRSVQVTDAIFREG